MSTNVDAAAKLVEAAAKSNLQELKDMCLHELTHDEESLFIAGFAAGASWVSCNLDKLGLES
jgi:hypothetical protein